MHRRHLLGIQGDVTVELVPLLIGSHRESPSRCMTAKPPGTISIPPKGIEPQLRRTSQCQAPSSAISSP